MKYESSYEDHFAHSEPYEDYLMHYGVKGMRWGVRRGEGTVSQRLNNANANRSIKSLNRRANKAESLGKTDKATKLRNRSNALKESINNYNKASQDRYNYKHASREEKRSGKHENDRVTGRKQKVYNYLYGSDAYRFY